MTRPRLALALTVLAAAIAIAWIRFAPSPRRQALARIEALHGTYTEQMGEDHKLNIVLLTARPVSESDLAALRDLRPVHRLMLDGSSVTDTGLEQVGELEELEFLTLGGTQITDAGVRSLRRLKHLQILSLRRTRITDAALDDLRELKELKSLVVAETRVTPRGVEDLKRALPHLEIIHIDADDD